MLGAIVRLEWKRHTSGISRWALKQDIIRRAVGAYLQEPRYIKSLAIFLIIQLRKSYIQFKWR